MNQIGRIGMVWCGNNGLVPSWILARGKPSRGGLNEENLTTGLPHVRVFWFWSFKGFQGGVLLARLIIRKMTDAE